MFLLFYTRYVSYCSWDIDGDEESLTLLQMYKGFKNDLDSNNCFINAVLQVILGLLISIGSFSSIRVSV